jgi:hypothetical protein
MKKIITSAVLFAAVVAGTPALATTVIDTTGGAGKFELGSFGGSTTYGQTFTVGGDTVLNSYSMYLTKMTSESFQFKSYIYQWNGTGVTGPALFTSGLQQASIGTDRQYAFSTTGLQLASNMQYVALMTVDGVPNTNAFGTMMPVVANTTYSGGNFVYTNSNTFGGRWDCSAQCSFGDAWLKASFSSAVPETATWGMMIAGFGVMGAALRTRRRSVRIASAA